MLKKKLIREETLMCQLNIGMAYLFFMVSLCDFVHFARKNFKL